MTYLPAEVVGQWFYLYLILDLYSRKIVGWEVHERDDANHAAHLVRRTALGEGIATLADKPVLHGDNGSTLKATTVLAMLNWLGVKPSYSRPRVSDDNAYAESLFRTAKYRPEFPARGFAEPRSRTGLGERLRALVQLRPPSQRHPLRQPGAAPCRRRSRDPRGSPCLVPRGSPTPPRPLVRQHAGLDADRRRHPQSRARRRGQRAPPLG